MGLDHQDMAFIDIVNAIPECLIYWLYFAEKQSKVKAPPHFRQLFFRVPAIASSTGLRLCPRPWLHWLPAAARTLAAAIPTIRPA